MKKDITHAHRRSLFRFTLFVVFAAACTFVISLFPATPCHCSLAEDTTLPDLTLMSAHFLDIPYAEKSTAQKMDVYLPKQGEKPYPVILWIHGDDRETASRRGQIATYANPVLKKGYAVVSVDYRYSSGTIFTARIYDVKAAVRHIKAVANTYDLDPSRIIAWGKNTGGILAALLAVSGDVGPLEDLSLGNPDQSSRIHGAIIWSGVFDFAQIDGLPAKSSKPGSTQSKRSNYAGSSIQELASLLNPATYISVDDPPFLIQHGTEDERIPAQQSILFATKLEMVLGSEMVFLNLIEGADHGDAAFLSNENMEIVINFLDTWTD